MNIESKFLKLIQEQSPKEPEIDDLPPEKDELGAAAPEPEMDNANTGSPELTSEAEAYLVGLIKKALLLDLDEESKKQIMHAGDGTGHITPNNAKQILDELVHLMDIEDGPQEVANLLDTI